MRRLKVLLTRSQPMEVCILPLAFAGTRAFLDFIPLFTSLKVYLKWVNPHKFFNQKATYLPFFQSYQQNQLLLK
ncbi:hypothetical protein DDT91_13795 [Algoriphagus sp. AK58]|nr:hypothetical protein [Algoriphagus sp. AK58]